VGVRAESTDLVEETFVAADPANLVARSRDLAAALWPDLTLTVTADRGDEGLRWAVTHVRGVPVVGSCEVWLERCGDGVLVHAYLRTPMTVREGRRRARHAKRVLWALKDEWEAGREPGTPAV
jgi:hypothetical protein